MEKIICEHCENIIAINYGDGFPEGTQVYHSMEGDNICKGCWIKESALTHKVQIYLKHGIAGLKKHQGG